MRTQGTSTFQPNPVLCHPRAQLVAECSTDTILPDVALKRTRQKVAALRGVRGQGHLGDRLPQGSPDSDPSARGATSADSRSPLRNVRSTAACRRPPPPTPGAVWRVWPTCEQNRWKAISHKCSVFAVITDAPSPQTRPPLCPAGPERLCEASRPRGCWATPGQACGGDRLTSLVLLPAFFCSFSCYKTKSHLSTRHNLRRCYFHLQITPESGLGKKAGWEFISEPEHTTTGPVWVPSRSPRSRASASTRAQEPEHGSPPSPESPHLPPQLLQAPQAQGSASPDPTCP